MRKYKDKMEIREELIRPGMFSEGARVRGEVFKGATAAEV